MSSVLTKSPNAAYDNSGVGTLTWSNTGNIFTSNNIRASVTFAAGTSATSHYLFASNFGFSVPTNATIVGLVVQWERARSGTGNSVTDSSVRLVVGGTVVGDNKSAGATWSAVEGYVSFGSDSDTWGLTPTPSEVNSSDFGVVISCACDNTSAGTDSTAHVDHVQISVYYVQSEMNYPSAHATYDIADLDSFYDPFDRVDWVNSTDARLDDEDYASATMSALTDGYTYVIEASDFGFAMDEAVTIDGIQVEIKLRKSGIDSEFNWEVQDALVKLSKATGTVTGTHQGTSNEYPTTAEYIVYGGQGNLWGTTWTPAEVNAADFAVAFAAHFTNQSADFDAAVEVDAIRVTVFYLSGEEESSASSSSSSPSSSSIGTSSSSSSRGTSSSSSSSSSRGTSSSSSLETSSSSSISSQSLSTSSSESSSQSASSESSSSSSIGTSSSSSSSSLGTSSSSASSLSSLSSPSSQSQSSESSSSSGSSSSSSSVSSQSSPSSESSSLSSLGTSSSSSSSSSSSVQFSSSSSSSASSSSLSSSSSSSSSTSSDIEHKPRERITFILKSVRAA